MDRNFNTVQVVIVVMESLSARRAWIEICEFFLGHDWRSLVALRKESVDRNEGRTDPTRHRTRVALRKESVDRNGSVPRLQRGHGAVALRKESVDRNTLPRSVRSLP